MGPKTRMQFANRLPGILHASYTAHDPSLFLVAVGSFAGISHASICRRVWGIKSRSPPSTQLQVGRDDARRGARNPRHEPPPPKKRSFQAKGRQGIAPKRRARKAPDKCPLPSRRCRQPYKVHKKGRAKEVLAQEPCVLRVESLCAYRPVWRRVRLYDVARHAHEEGMHGQRQGPEAHLLEPLHT